MGLPTDFPPQITDLTQALETLEQIRRWSCQVSEWTTEELSERNIGGRLAAAMVTQGRVGDDAANVAVREIERVFRLTGSHALDLASAVRLLATEVQTLVVEPIQSAGRLPRTSMGLRVND